jgi:hypothetical protein
MRSAALDLVSEGMEAGQRVRVFMGCEYEEGERKKVKGERKNKDNKILRGCAIKESLR